jgi:aspartate/methionine/tyrosine aminotransferase
LMSAGAYFGYVKHPYKGRASLDLAKDMARKSGILVIPGIFFGAVQDDYLRFAFANAGRDIITQLPDRIGYL